MAEIDGRVAVVTGGGSGIGRATCLALADAGATVAICDLNLVAAEETREQVESRGYPGSAHAVDVADEASTRELVAAVLRTHDHVDIVVNNAGIAVDPVPTADVGLDIFRRVLDVNLLGVANGSVLWLPHLQSRPHGNLVNVASYAAFVGIPGMAPYCASKFGVRGLTEALQVEMMSTSVAVTLVCPGSTRTAMMRNSPVIDPSRREALQKGVETARLASPDTVARRIVRGIRRDSGRVLCGPDTRALDWLTRHAPRRYPRLISGPMKRTLKAFDAGAG